MDVERDPHAPTPPPGQDQLPSEDGEPMDMPRHRDQMNLLIATGEPIPWPHARAEAATRRADDENRRADAAAARVAELEAALAAARLRGA